MLSYRIVQEADRQWYIVNADDTGLVWADNHWCDPEQRGARPLGFGSESAAAEYADQVFGVRRN